MSTSCTQTLTHQPLNTNTDMSTSCTQTLTCQPLNTNTDMSTSCTQTDTSTSEHKHTHQPLKINTDTCTHEPKHWHINPQAHKQWHTNPLLTNNDTSTPCPQTMTLQPLAHKQRHINPLSIISPPAAVSAGSGFKYASMPSSSKAEPTDPVFALHYYCIKETNRCNDHPVWCNNTEHTQAYMHSYTCNKHTQ